MKYYYTLSLNVIFFVLSLLGEARQKIPVLDGYDPGPCNYKNHGKEYLAKDRDDDEIILICVKDKNGYKWKSADGTKNTVGEFFNPGYDCADILNKRQDSQDGFYWINLQGKNLRKVYCDMNTDGGGFMLVGRQNVSKTWKVPSNNNPLDPYSEPHWLSNVGDAPIIDFRIQMATKEDFKETKAHWSLRVQNERPLKNLMTTTLGCDQRSAGIGNIAYVKDLMTEKIVTTNFRCSKFGFAHNVLLKFGWAMLNSCLNKPCPAGFAFHPLVNIAQTDFYGGFSFSTTGKISGMEYNSTAFIGCDNGHCCGCYGPAGGTKNYCTHNCQPINGGRITKNMYTWFWVRSSLPERIWKKCMDYQVKRYDGKLISYKLVGHSVVPVEGRCSKGSALLRDGTLVVPDSSTAKKVPAIDGLLQFREDRQELYVRTNKSWEALALKEEIRKQIAELKNMTKNLEQTFRKRFPYHKECSEYTWLREATRNRGFTSTTYLCDQGFISTGWYRFGGAAGNKIASSCVPQHKCQGDYTGWMRGPHPKRAHGKVTRQVCFSHNKCCEWTDNIEVINCGGYFVYKLVPPSKCRARYCGSSL